MVLSAADTWLYAMFAAYAPDVVPIVTWHGYKQHIVNNLQVFAHPLPPPHRRIYKSSIPDAISANFDSHDWNKLTLN